eukprot:scaffold24196_cov120-Isochrysis_galbana.AAC.5
MCGKRTQAQEGNAIDYSVQLTRIQSFVIDDTADDISTAEPRSPAHKKTHISRRAVYKLTCGDKILKRQCEAPGDIRSLREAEEKEKREAARRCNVQCGERERKARRSNNKRV